MLENGWISINVSCSGVCVFINILVPVILQMHNAPLNTIVRTERFYPKTKLHKKRIASEELQFSAAPGIWILPPVLLAESARQPASTKYHVLYSH